MSVKHCASALNGLVYDIIRWPLKHRKYPSFCSMVIYYLLFIVSVAYLTLFERHLLGLAQLRLGSNKPSWRGVLQPLLDALKLLQKISLSP